MSPRPDIDALLPDDATRRARRDALVAGLRPAPVLDGGARDPLLTRRRLVRAGAVGGGALAVGLVGTTVLPGLGGSPVDVLGQARAAVAPQTGGILHTVVRFRATPSAGPVRLTSGPIGAAEDEQTFGTPTGRTEQWSAEDPYRRHLVRFIDVEGRAAPVRAESSYAADGTYRERPFWQQDVVRTGRLDRRTRASTDRLRRRLSSPTSLLGIDGATDPVAVLRSLLASSALRPAGTTEIGGREVRRLVGRDAAWNGPLRSPATATRVEVLVDADDFTPVRITTTWRLPARPGDQDPAARRPSTVRTTLTFERYERLPLNADTAGLLQVDTTGRRIVRTDDPGILF
jgi:hypothetical protein